MSYIILPVSQWKPRVEQEHFAPNWSTVRPQCLHSCDLLPY